MKQIIRTEVGLWLSLAVVGLTLLPSGAVLAQVAACRSQASSYAQGILDPKSGGDEEFFLKPSGPPNVAFLISNSVSMQQLTNRPPDPPSTEISYGPYFGTAFNNGFGCPAGDPVDSIFNAQTDGTTKLDTDYTNEFDPRWYQWSYDAYPSNYVAWSDQMPWDGSGVSAQSNLGMSSDTKTFYSFYQYGYDFSSIRSGSWPNTTTACGTYHYVSSPADTSTWANYYTPIDQSAVVRLLTSTTSSPTNSWTTYLASLGYANVNQAALDAWGLCLSCLASKGWFRGPAVQPTTPPNNHGYTYAFSGRFLNKFPPKLALGRKALKDVVLASDRVRIGVATTSTTSNLYDPAIMAANSGSGSGAYLEPDCDKALANTGFNTARNDTVKKIQSIVYNGQGDSIAEALLSLGGYYSSQASANPNNADFANWFTISDSLTMDNGLVNISPNYPASSSWGSDSDTMWLNNPTASGGSRHDSFCFSCQVSTVVLLTDTAFNADNTVPVDAMDYLVKHPVNSGNAYPISDPGGINTCIHNCGCTSLFPGGVACTATVADGGLCVDACDYTVDGKAGPASGNKNFVDDVAYFLAHQDLRSDYSGQQIVHTYTIGLGSGNDAMLAGIAEAGKGKYFSGSSLQSLEGAIYSALGDIMSLSTSGASSSINSVQSSSAASVFVPRFVPVSQKAFWPGDLISFKLYNEQAAPNCTDGGGSGDLNGNHSCNDIYLIDRDNSPVGPDSQGIIDPTTPGKFYKLYSDGGVSPTPANPFWSAEALLADGGLPNRQIWTALDTNNDGDIDSQDSPFRLKWSMSASDLNNLLPYLGLSNDPNGFCQNFAVQTQISEISPAIDPTYATCAQYLVRFVLGYDVLNEEKLANPRVAAQNPRPSGILGDIFHSPPVKVTLPVPESLCRTQLSPQCLPTLFERPPLAHGAPVAVDSSTGLDAYQQWQNDAIANRQANVVVVGGNDGMLHVFKADCWVAGDDPSTVVQESFYMSPDPALCSGATVPGTELFAFIPPDLLPKLKLLVGATHNAYVDGSPMVRDIWYDSNHDGIKQKSEYHTVVITGERRGGTHYFALDITDPFNNGTDPMHLPSGGSRFLYLYPKLSHMTDLAFGESWNDYLPRPPPVGPIRLKTAGSGMPYSYSAPLSSGNFEERWAAMVSGGYDPLGIRGRGVALFDAYTGATIESFRPDTMSGAVQQYMKYSFAAAPGLLNEGNSTKSLTQPDNQVFFDTATVGDMGGQVWTFRFYDPDPNNWGAGRAFQEYATDGTSESHRFPIFDSTGHAQLPNSGFVRVAVGTGDRQHLRDQGVGKCTMQNLKACEELGCTVTVAGTYQVGGDTLTAAYKYTGPNATDTSTSLSVTVADAGISWLPSGTMSYTVPSYSLTGGSGTCNTVDETTPQVEVNCSLNSGDDVVGNGAYACGPGDAGCYEDPNLVDPVDAGTFSPSGLAYTNRFVSFTLFDDIDGGGRGIFNTQAQANVYDSARLEDYGTSSSTTLTQAYPDGGATVGEYDRGWVLPYLALDERTSTNPIVTQGCVFWSTVQGGTYCQVSSDCCDKLADGGLDPTCSATCNTTIHECQNFGPCSKVGTSSKFSYSADVVTGAAGCGTAFQPDGGAPVRRIACVNCDVLPPPAPTPVIFIDKNGQMRTALLGIGGAGLSNTSVSSADDLVKNLYEILVPTGLHSCRHAGSASTAQCSQ